MSKEQSVVSARIVKIVEELEQAGFKNVYDYEQKNWAALTGAEKSQALSLPVDFSKETIDIHFDKESGEIIDWRKTPRLHQKGMVTFQLPLTEEAGSKFARTMVIDKLSEGMADEVARQVDKAIKEEEVLQHVGENMALTPLTDAARSLMVGQRVLLLVHGIFSETAAAFDGLSDIEKDLRVNYGQNIIAYDHFTLCKTTEENATDLIRQLPSGSMIDIVCHSRGAGVVRYLLESAENQAALTSANIRVGTVCYVAGACMGSPLASKEWSATLFKMLNRAMVLGGAAPWWKAMALVIRATISGVQHFPGVEAMNPGSKIIGRLNRSISAARRYAYIRANFDPANVFLRLGDQAVIDWPVFEKEHNDMIVPWEGAGAHPGYAVNVSKENVLDFKPGGAVQRDVWHVNFFKKPAVQGKLLDELKVWRAS